MKICKNTLSFKDKDKSKKSSINFRKKSSNNISEKNNKLQKTKPKLLINITKENSAEKENNKNNSNQKRKQVKNPKTKKVKNKSNKNFTKEANKITNLSSFKCKNKLKSPEKKNLTSFNLENLLINMKITENKENNIEKDEYREMFSKYVRDDYSNSILETLLKDDFVVDKFLVHHKITPRMRTRMADWMIEVLSNYNCDDLTYFESINLMDRYFKECENRKIILLPEDLHLIGVTSMFIASKYHDIKPLRLKTVHEKIAHEKLSCEQIKNKEDEISRFLNYSFGLPTMWDFITIFIEEIFYVKYNSYQIQNKILLDTYYKVINNDDKMENNKNLVKMMNKLYTKNMLHLLKTVCIYLAKMNCHDYELMQNKQSLLAASTIFVAMKICEKINEEQYINDYFNSKLTSISKQDENSIIPIAQKILYNAQHFDEAFSGLENLKKVNFNAIIEIKNTK
jgi:hypothetical protein